MPTTAILALEDGRCFLGTSYGASGTITGEACFNTSMYGYQEIITDPSYRGQIVTMTSPAIGNTGINPEDEESSQPHISALVIEELCEVPSNWRSTEDLSSYLKRHNVLGIENIDTRALTKHLRTQGTLRACITTELSQEEAIAVAKNTAPIDGADLVKEVTTKETYDWSGESREWVLPNVLLDQSGPYLELEAPKYKIVALDLGIRHSQLRLLRQAGFETEVVPATTTAAEILAKNPDALFISSGPGDPAALTGIHAQVKELATKLPVFAIGLGNLVLAHAFGAKTFKLKFGHHGANQPVKDLHTGKVAITSQKYDFAIDPDTLPEELEVTHTNLNDNTIEGLRHKTLPVYSIQYHPDAESFQEFAALIEKNKA